MRELRLCADSGKRSQHLHTKEAIKVAHKIGRELGAVITEKPR